MKTSEIFKLAKEDLWNGESLNLKKGTEKFKFICHAITCQNKCTPNDKARAKEILMNLLFPKDTLSDWLEIKGFPAYNKDNIVKLQSARHAWLNHLIKHYQSIGD